MKLLILTEKPSDLSDALSRCPAEVGILSAAQAMKDGIEGSDAFCVLGDEGPVLDGRLRRMLEAEAAKGKKIFLEAVNSFGDIYSDNFRKTTFSRLVCAAPEGEDGIPGLSTGDLLDDECGRAMRPWFPVPGMTPLLVYRERIIAHTHADLDAGEIMKNSAPGLFRLGNNVLMAMFVMRNYVKARFAPRGNWEKLVKYIALFLTGTEPVSLPEHPLRFGPAADLSDPAEWERCRKEAVRNGIRWLENFLVDDGEGGVREGLRHNISPEGRQLRLDGVRSDCSGEAAGAFAMYARLNGSARHERIAENIRCFLENNMVIREEPYSGMVRWSDSAWRVCYHDDAARSVIPSLLGSLFMEDERHFGDICARLDFLVKTTCRDGLAEPRVDIWAMDEEKLRARREQEHGCPSAHYNAYYSAALLLAYKKCGKPEYLDTARRGLERLMELYPETRREQSETEEMCRLVLPLAALFDVTHEEKHREFLYRVTGDLEKLRHPFGGYREWDTGYKASCSRESTGECSLLAENGDPVTDSLYSSNWLPMGFAYAYCATGDEMFRGLWENIASYYIRTQMLSEDPMLNGAWCRAFDMDLGEAYGCPHDVGWAANCCETGWTVAEILMGLMLPEILPKAQMA